MRFRKWQPARGRGVRAHVKPGDARPGSESRTERPERSRRGRGPRPRSWARQRGRAKRPGRPSAEFANRLGRASAPGLSGRRLGLSAVRGTARVDRPDQGATSHPQDPRAPRPPHRTLAPVARSGSSVTPGAELSMPQIPATRQPRGSGAVRLRSIRATSSHGPERCRSCPPGPTGLPTCVPRLPPRLRTFRGCRQHRRYPAEAPSNALSSCPPEIAARLEERVKALTPVGTEAAHV